MEVSSSTSTLVAAASADPVSSLRAAALSTLKSKRSRKPVVEKSAPAPISRPPPPSEFQLDYGQEDTPMNIDPPSPKETAEVEVHVQEAQMREEGEISDEEDAVPTVLVKDPTPPPRRPARSPRPPRSVTPESIKTAYVNPPSPPKSFTGKQQAPPSLLDRFSDVMDYQPSEKILEPPEVAMQTDNVLELERSWQSLGPDRVRPGVLLTMDEYETVKDIVLDLLGWGVPPAFLVACGVTKEVVYYVFTELNLELPEGFDTTGMIPYTPELFAQLQESALMPPPPLPDNRRVVEDHVEETPSPTLQIEAATSSDSPSNTDLHDMERQRRQELMARKAVQASRKMKQVNSTDSNSTALTNESSGADQDDVSATSTIPSETVDDFLKSIGPVVEMDPPSAAQTPVGWPRTNGDAMDLDEVTAPLDDSQYVSIPRMRSDTLSPYSANAYEPASPSSRADTPNEPPPMSGDEPPPTSSDSMTTTYSQLSQTITPVASSSQLLPPKVNTVQRRGVKRPVASDFVDYDPAPRRNEMNGRVEQSNNPAFSNALTRRLNLTTNFQNIPSPKCVIQLSDSEGEDEEEQEQPQIQQTMEDRSWLQRDRRSKAAKYPSPVPRPSASAAEIMSPTVLEDRIRKMHEEIARKEEATRLRKLAQMAKPIPASGSSTPSVLPKQEDSDVVMSSSGTEMLERNGHAGRSSNGAYRKSESATPPPASPSRSVSKDPLDDDALHDDHSSQATITITPHRDSASEAQEAQVDIIPGLQQSQQQIMEEERRSEATREGTVDVDSELSSSAQPEWKAVSATQKQDERKQPAWETPPSPSGNNDHHQDDENYAIYSSPFESYPLLRGRSRPTFSSDQVSHSHSLSLHSSSYMYPSTSSMSSSSPVSAETSSYSISSPSYPFPNLKPLKLATMSKVLDPFKRLCRYEVPGGGMCRDEGCEDVHLNRLDGVNEMGVVEPSDRDTAEYLFNTMPSSWLERYQVSSSSKIFEALQQIRYNTVNDPLGFEDRVAQALFALGDSRPT